MTAWDLIERTQRLKGVWSDNTADLFRLAMLSAKRKQETTETETEQS